MQQAREGETTVPQLLSLRQKLYIKGSPERCVSVS